MPWQDPNTKTGFSWTKYLEATRSKIAPSKIFDEMSRFPHSTNRFKVGMKLEAIDPEHPALFCVVTVVSIKGWVSCPKGTKKFDISILFEKRIFCSSNYSNELNTFNVLNMLQQTST